MTYEPLAAHIIHNNRFVLDPLFSLVRVYDFYNIFLSLHFTDLLRVSYHSNVYTRLKNGSSSVQVMT